MTRARDVANIDGLLTTTGDTYYASAAATPARLGVGSTGQVLTVASGVPSWATPAASGGFTLLSTTTLSSRNQVISSIDQSYKHLFVLVTGLNSTTQALYTSTDGITWTGRTTVNGTLNVSCYLYDIAYGAGLYVAVGYGGTVNTSVDGITWTLRTTGLTSADTFVSIEYDATLSRFIALTNRSTTDKGIKVSTDGITWADPTVGSYYGGNSYGTVDNTTSKVLAKLNGKWFACAGAGGENLISSTDGLTWTTVLNASNTFNFT
jgi:Tfp pilus assembly protein PilV